HAAEGCRDIQRPAEMFARMAKADAQAVMRADLVVETADEGELLRQRRRGFGGPALQLPADLARQPGLTLRAAADHHGIGAGFPERIDRGLVRGDVAIDDERD